MSEQGKVFQVDQGEAVTINEPYLGVRKAEEKSQRTQYRMNAIKDDGVQITAFLIVVILAVSGYFSYRMFLQINNPAPQTPIYEVYKECISNVSSSIDETEQDLRLSACKEMNALED